MGKFLGFISGPILFFIIILSDAPEGLSENGWKVMGCGILMVVWWVSGAVPVAVTSMIPIALFPLFGIASVAQSTAPYSSPIIYLFLGGFLIGAAVEKWNLHKRIALNILSVTGSSLKGIIAGFILSAGFISMWMSNTATVVMMLPIAASVIDLLSTSHSSEVSKKNFAAALLISIAYAASIGGVATLIGSPPNGIFVAFMNEAYNFDISFAQWLLVALPFSLIMLALCWFVLVKIAFPISQSNADISLFKKELKKMGSISIEEKLLIIVFLITATAWVFSPLIKESIKGGFVSDASIAMMAAISLFIIPTNLKKGKFLLDWEKAKNIPWGVLILFGGGLSLAAALQYSGVIAFFETKISTTGEFNVLTVIGVVVSAISVATTFIGNAALTGIALPIVSSLSLQLNINPLILTLVTTIAASCAFMLPMSTPPNAVIYSNENVKMSDLVKAGFILNIIAVIVIIIIIYPLMEYSFGVDLSIIPEWAKRIGK